MRQLKFFLLFISLLFFANQIFSQQFKFTEREKYLDELKEFFSRVKNNKIEDFYKDFAKSWERGEFTEDEMNFIYNESVLLVNKKAIPLHLYNYLMVKTLFNRSGHSPSSYTQWQNYFTRILQNNKISSTKINEFLDFTWNLLKTNLLYKSLTTRWRAGSQRYRFENFHQDSLRLVFDGQTDLICYAYHDSTIVHNTTGVYYPQLIRWVGEGGRVTWERVGLAESEVYADLKKYEIEMTKSSFMAKEVSFMNQKYSRNLSYGELEEKVQFRDTIQRKDDSEEKKQERRERENTMSAYPKFKSSEKTFFLKDVFPNIDFEGGFSMQGKKFIGMGNKEADARLCIRRGVEPFIIASSASFTFIQADVDERGNSKQKKEIEKTISSVTSQNVKITLYLRLNGRLDSIYHPNLDFQYVETKNIETKVVSRRIIMQRVSEGGENIPPFFNSFHNLDMDFEQLIWNVDSSTVTFKPLSGSSKKTANFTSIDYFDTELYDKLRYLGTKHPMVMMKNYAEDRVKQSFGKKNPTKDEITAAVEKEKFSPEDLAKGIRRNLDEVKRLLIEYAQFGFVFYDRKANLVSLNKRLFDFLRMHGGTRDFDRLTVVSDAEFDKKNADLRLDNLDLTIYGVESVVLSEARGTIFFPKEDTVANKKVKTKSSKDKVQRIVTGQKRVLMKKNRDLYFDGLLRVGATDFFGKDFVFKYDSFRIDLNSVDSVLFCIPARKIRADSILADRYRLVPVLSTLEKVKGKLQIDHPLNKAGKDSTNLKIKELKALVDSKDKTKKINLKTFPIFKNEVKSRVFYDRYPMVFQTQKRENFIFHDLEKTKYYKRDSFYFETNPFVLNGLDSLGKVGRDSIKIAGRFVSSIFPEFDEYLSVQGDKSLGFTHDLKTSTPLYDGKGHFKGKLKLSRVGLQGTGEVQYLVSTTEADKNRFYFAPDSMNAFSHNFRIAKQTSGTEFPSLNTVKGDTAWVHWEPKRDILLARNSMLPPNWDKKKMPAKKANPLPFEMFDQKAKMNGIVMLKPEGLTGDGIMDFVGAEMESEKYDYKANTFDSDIASFKIVVDTSFSIDRVAAHINFIDSIGSFKAIDTITDVQFKHNFYKCYMDRFTWLMKKEVIGIVKPLTASAKKVFNETDIFKVNEEELGGVKFISTHPNQNELTFKSDTALFDIRKKNITAYNVKLIHSADALIFPSTAVVIYKNAQMQTLADCRIVTEPEHKFHLIYNSTVNISGRLLYTATGDYNYVTVRDSIEKVHFSSVRPDDNLQTVAIAKISPQDKFTLGPIFSFIGEIKLESKQKHLKFTGFSRMEHPCKKLDTLQFAFSASINPDTIFIPVMHDTATFTQKEKVVKVNVSKDMKNEKLFASLFLTQDSSHIYSTFLTRMKNYSDIDLFDAKGFLYYDSISDAYIVSRKEKILNPTFPTTKITREKENFKRGPTFNYLKLSRKSCELYGEGIFDLGADLGQVSLMPVGNVKHYLDKDIIEFDLMLGVDFPLPDKCFDLVYERVANATGNPQPFLPEETSFKQSMIELVDTVQTNRMLSDLTVPNRARVFPEIMQHKFLFGNVKLKWNTKTHSYRTFDRFAMVGIGNRGLYKYINGYIELIKKRSGETLYIYLEPSEREWFFFVYSKGQMKTYSSNEEYNSVISKTKAKNRKIVDKNRPDVPYSFDLSNEKAKETFLRSFRNTDEDEEEKDKEEKEDKD